MDYYGRQTVQHPQEERPTRKSPAEEFFSLAREFFQREAARATEIVETPRRQWNDVLAQNIPDNYNHRPVDLSGTYSRQQQEVQRPRAHVEQRQTIMSLMDIQLPSQQFRRPEPMHAYNRQQVPTIQQHGVTPARRNTATHVRELQTATHRSLTSTNQPPSRNPEFATIVRLLNLKVRLAHHSQNWARVPKKIQEQVGVIFDNITPPGPTTFFRDRMEHLKQTFLTNLSEEVRRHIQEMKDDLETSLATFDEDDGDAAGHIALKQIKERNKRIPANFAFDHIRQGILSLKTTEAAASQLRPATPLRSCPPSTLTSDLPQHGLSTLPPPLLQRQRPATTATIKTTQDTLSMSPRNCSLSPLMGHHSPSSTPHRSPSPMDFCNIPPTAPTSGTDTPSQSTSQTAPTTPLVINVPAQNSGTKRTRHNSTGSPEYENLGRPLPVDKNPKKHNKPTAASQPSNHSINDLQAASYTTQSRSRSRSPLKSRKDNHHTVDTLQYSNVCKDAAISYNPQYETLVIGDSNVKFFAKLITPPDWQVVCIPGLRFANFTSSLLPPSRSTPLNIIIVVGINNRNVDFKLSTSPTIMNTLALLQRFAPSAKLFATGITHSGTFPAGDIKNINDINTKLRSTFPLFIEPIPSAEVTLDRPADPVHHDRVTASKILNSISNFLLKN